MDNRTDAKINLCAYGITKFSNNPASHKKNAQSANNHQD